MPQTTTHRRAKRSNQPDLRLKPTTFVPATKDLTACRTGSRTPTGGDYFRYDTDHQRWEYMSDGGAWVPAVIARPDGGDIVLSYEETWAEMRAEACFRWWE